MLLILVIMAMSSCSKTHRIPKKYLDLIPYKEGEILVFKSNKKKFDTIFINTVSNSISVNDPLGVFSDKEEMISVAAKLDRKSSFVSRIVSLSSTEKKGLILQITFRTNEGCYYNLNAWSVSTLENLNIHKLKIQNKLYEDIWIFTATDRKFEERDDFIEKLYWSKSKGVIRYDKKNGEFWELLPHRSSEQTKPK